MFWYFMPQLRINKLHISSAGVMFLSFVVNQRRVIRLSFIDQFIMAYGGLRGGIAFCLALLLNSHHIPEKAMFVSTTMVMVFFTVFVQVHLHVTYHLT